MHLPSATSIFAPQVLVGLAVALISIAVITQRPGLREPAADQQTFPESPAVDVRLDPRLVAPPVATPIEIIDRILDLAQVDQSDVVYDLGSGDGRIVIRAAVRFGARGVGIEIDPRQVATAVENANQANVDDLVSFQVGNVLTADLSSATIVTMFLGSNANRALRPRLQNELTPGSRVVSFMFSMDAWMPERIERFVDSEGVMRTLYLWRVAAQG